MATESDWERIFAFWAQGPGETERNRSDNAVRRIRTAISNSSKLKDREIKVFTQGSYKNRVNVRQDSDVDVGVMLHEIFIDEYPEGKTRADFDISPATYTYRQFKDELGEALVAHFGRASVKRGNKAFNIRQTSYQVEADVVPFFEYRRYWDNGTYRAGVGLRPDRGGQIVNFPERLLEVWPRTPLHYENGVSKNKSTSRRFKRVVRILKKLRNKMEDVGYGSTKGVPGYLLECMAWNIANTHFEGDSWYKRVRVVLYCIKIHTGDDEKCKSWCEVDNIKYLFRRSQPWTRADVHAFIEDARSYIGVN